MDILHKVAKIHGSVVKINMHQSVTHHGFLDFTILYVFLKFDVVYQECLVASMTKTQQSECMNMSTTSTVFHRLLSISVCRMKK